MNAALFSRVKTSLVLYALNLRIKFRFFIDYFIVAFKYYSDFLFFRIDTSLLLAYFFRNPFSVSRQFLQMRGESDVYTYGETPLSTMEKIARLCEISDRDVFFELGSGRGRACFWMHRFVGCRVVGIEYVPFFVRTAERIQRRFHLKGLDFRSEDLFEADLTGATVIYLYGTCFSDRQMERLIEKFEKLPGGTKIITVSDSLDDYKPFAPFQVVKRFPAQFTWGMAEVTLQIRRER